MNEGLCVRREGYSESKKQEDGFHTVHTVKIVPSFVVK
jgi:hypothetical protein